VSGADRPVVELRSDTFTLPTPEMRAAIQRASLGDDVYGEDPTVNRLERLAADRVGKDAACLMPSGTMANLSAIMAHAPRGTKVVVGADSDIYSSEAGGAAVCAGTMYAPVANEPDGRLALADIATEFPADPGDPQFASPSLLCLEDTHNRCGGAVLPLTYLRDLHDFARARGVAVHLDGARLFNAAVAIGCPATTIAESADSVQFCLSKGLSAPVGSIVGGSVAFIDRVRRARKLLGGGMRQAGIIAAAGIVALQEMVDRLAEDHGTAQALAAGLASIPAVELITPPGPRTNIVTFRLRSGTGGVAAFLAETRRRSVLLAEVAPGRIRAVTHRGVGGADIEQALEVIAEVLGLASVVPGRELAR
jgi:threonine aldolase